jgi:hypothetical protein
MPGMMERLDAAWRAMGPAERAAERGDERAPLDVFVAEETHHVG